MIGVTPHQLRILILSDPSDPHVLHAIRENVLRGIERRIPARKGVCSAGHRVVMDEKGAMSSGYLLHAEGYGICNHDLDHWDEPTERVAALQAEHARLLEQSREYRRRCQQNSAFRAKRLA